MKTKKPEGITRQCLVPECGYRPTSRGLCLGHYNAAKRLIKAGRTTWAELEKRGKSNQAKFVRDKSWFLS